jgi:hypothetical protein
MGSLLNDVNILITKRIGDLSRLEHIKQTIENNKQLYDSDRKYLDELIEKHLFSKTKSDHNYSPKTTKQSTKELSNPKIEDEPKSKSNPENEPKAQESFCENCGASKAKEHDFCTKCGAKINSKSNSNNTKKIQPPKKKSSKKKKIGIIFGVLILLFFIGFSIPSDTNMPTSGSNPTITNEQPKVKSYSQMNEKELELKKIDWKYKDLLRNIDEYSGKIIFVEGKVTNIQRDIDSINLCTNGYRDYGVFTCEEFMFVNVNGITTWLEDDQLSGFVEVKRLSETGSNNVFTGGEWIGNGEYVPKVNEVRLTCSNC